MKKPLLLIWLLAGLFSCVNKDKAPAGILSQEKMKGIFYDLARSDQFVADFVSKDSTLDQKQESLRLYEEVFALHGVKREEFRKSFDYYRAHPDMLKTIMDSLNTIARKKEQEAYQTQVSKPDEPKPFTPVAPDTAKPRIKPIKKRLDSLGLKVRPE